MAVVLDMESLLQHVNRVLGTWYADTYLVNVFFFYSSQKKVAENICICVGEAKIYTRVMP